MFRDIREAACSAVLGSGVLFSVAVISGLAFCGVLALAALIGG